MRRLLRIDRFHVFASDVGALARAPSVPPSGIEFAWIEDAGGLEAIDRASAADGGFRRHGTMSANLAAGGGIAAAICNGVPVAWQMFRPRKQITLKWVHLRADGGSMFSFGSYTVQEWRGRHLMAQLSSFAARTHAEQGYRRHCSVADLRNRSALRARVHRGDRRIGWITRFQSVRGWSLVVCDNRLAAGVFSPSHPFLYSVGSRSAAAATGDGAGA